MFIPEITKIPHWTSYGVRRVCIDCGLYTEGDNEAYASMLHMVESNPTPSVIGLYMVAKDIAEHSEHQTITNVMFILENQAITYTFTLDGRDDI